MGEVWKARDSRLGREVAIKILPAEFAADAQLRERFEREAKAISRLNHPNICTLYDVGEGYLVMELLEGESLDHRLGRGAMPVEDVLRYGAQIAAALDRAHRAGIVHRDLKPGNVVITKQGAKLLDFGLAKSARIHVRGDDSTQQKPLTEEGTIVGTFQYMAPEQLEGQDVDHRTDIFALGATLYEMTTGKPAFEGETRVSLTAAIMTARPQPVTPPALEHVISKCLNRDPEERWQSAHDVAGELQWIGSAPPAAAMPARRRSRELIWIAALLAAIILAAWLAFRPRPRAEVIDATIVPDGNNGLQWYNGPPALSPDGKVLAYSARDGSGRPMIWLRSMNEGTTKPLAGSEGAFCPSWSPDGRFLAFFTGSADLKKISAGGGASETIASRTTGICGATWNRDDVILYVGAEFGSPIYRVRASGGEPVAVLVPASVGAARLLFPFFLPDGNHFVCLALGGAIEQRGQAGVWLAALDGTTAPRFLTQTLSTPMYVEPGFLLFARDGVLRAQRFDAKTLRLSGEAATIAPIQLHTFAALFTATPSLLIYQPAGSTQLSELVVKTRKGEVVRILGGPAFHWSPRVSPDGQRIAVDRSDANGKGDIWLVSAGDGAASRFTFEAAEETAPVWSPRGDEVVYSMDNLPAAGAVFGKRIGERPRSIVELQKGYLSPTDWSADGRHLALTRWGSGQDFDAVVWSVGERKLFEVSATRANEGVPVFSPDGKWVAYQSDESGRHEIYVQPFPPTGAKEQVSTAGGLTPRWSRGGEIFWVDPNNRLNAATVVTTPSFRAARPELLFQIDQRDVFSPQYDVSPDGNILVNSLVRGQPHPMTVVLNWRRRFD